MSNIIGATISLRNFLSKEKGEVKVRINIEEEKLFELAKDRTYVIPHFQREIRWKKENVIELISDIAYRPKFLGNIILSAKGKSNYEIIDGQQRITVLLMILQYIKYKFFDSTEVVDTCDLKIESFEGFSRLLELNFNLGQEEEKIDETDHYKQRKKYNEIWNNISQSKILENSKSVREFLDNLYESEVNIILTTDNIISNGIRYFLDVNLKGVKLDTEDIFKGYLFSQDTSDEIRGLWKQFKKLTFDIASKPISMKYVPMKILEQYFYCDLYLEERYNKVRFNEKFLLKEKVIMDDNEEHYVGEHLLKFLINKTYMKRAFERINKYLEAVKDIVSTTSPSMQFKGYFDRNAKIDYDEMSIIHNFMKKILKDNIEVPKILVMKYMISILLNGYDCKISKNDYRKIYGVYVLSVFFSIFEDDKKGAPIYNMVKSEEWYENLLIKVNECIKYSELNMKGITSKHIYYNKGNEDDQQFRCKSLATIYNYFNIKKESINIIEGKYKELLQYITNTEEYCVEHFIINDNDKSGKYSICINGKEEKFEYPKNVRNYANSLFNFLFISREENERLKNYDIKTKISMIKQNKVFNNESCSYSVEAFKIIQKNFKSFPEIDKFNSIEEARSELDKYYSENFEEEYLQYAEQVIKKVFSKLL